MCQKLWKLDDSRQSYCKNYLAYFFGPPCSCVDERVVDSLIVGAEYKRPDIYQLINYDPQHLSNSSIINRIHWSIVPDNTAASALDHASQFSLKQKEIGPTWLCRWCVVSWICCRFAGCRTCRRWGRWGLCNRNICTYNQILTINIVPQCS